ncbi:ribosome biogenesis GTP-binding protein YihA/YsxC [Oharaeibacter diazotrophicus]|uniref:ribosome biogenesis GTP-binding protein YihA/YsxC n=1 Tax=Oharaeibacter diazotrophicus TaxID=1920512 RepID=UPI00247A8D04|nr:ribosome biogenesis GTP-binding protein YihA/YsxC [Oharaeibacter diazotrophicus]
MDGGPGPRNPEPSEAVRLLFARPWTFVRGMSRVDDLPPVAGTVEVAFAGRSNVGKSSLINALTGQGGLARTSNTPGRTQELNLFKPERDSGVFLVDMPGYGYAEAPKEKVDVWNRLIRDYLRGRPNLRRVFVLIDGRHGLKKNDEEVLDLLDKAAVSYQVVLTKADKLKPGGIAKLAAETLERIRKRPAAHPEVLTTSSEKGAGIDELRAAIAALIG